MLHLREKKIQKRIQINFESNVKNKNVTETRYNQHHINASRVQLGLWNRVVPDGRLEAEVDALVEVLLSKNQQAVRQLKFIINRGVEADLYTAQGFEALSAGLTGAVNGAWQVPDADAGEGVAAFTDKGSLWQQRRGLAREFWSDPGSTAA